MKKKAPEVPAVQADDFFVLTDGQLLGRLLGAEDLKPYRSPVDPAPRDGSSSLSSTAPSSLGQSHADHDSAVCGDEPSQLPAYRHAIQAVQNGRYLWVCWKRGLLAMAALG